MIFGKHINRYYLKNAALLLLGLAALVLVDFFQLKVPELYRGGDQWHKAARLQNDDREWHSPWMCLC